MGTIIDVRDPGLAGARFFDCRASLADPDDGRKRFLENHIPGAIHADLNRDLSSPVQAGITGRHPLPARTDFISTVSGWGLTSDSIVVAYDDDTGAFAARLWWLMRWLGHENAFVLDGGLVAWVTAGRHLTSEISAPAASVYHAAEPLTRQVVAEEVSRWRGLLIDARDPIRFRGEVEPIDPVAGHIPGAVNRPFLDNLDGGQFRPPGQLRSQFTALGANTSHTACYCGSGVTAAHNILAIVHGGLPEPALYAGSWSEWITDPERPVARGAAP